MKILLTFFLLGSALSFAGGIEWQQKPALSGYALLNIEEKDGVLYLQYRNGKVFTTTDLKHFEEVADGDWVPYDDTARNSIIDANGLFLNVLLNAGLTMQMWTGDSATGPWDTETTPHRFNITSTGTFGGKFLLGGREGQLLIGTQEKEKETDPPPQLEISLAFKLKWQTEPGKAYTVQGSNDLKNWNDIETINGTGQEVSTVADGFQFFRVASK